MQAGRTQQRKMSPRQKANRTVVRWLLVCFPVGLIMMWSDNCRWRRMTKTAVSMAIVLFIVALALPLTRAPQPRAGGIQYVSTEGAADPMGPTINPDAEHYEAYVPKYVPQAITIAEPTPTPVPYYVYCNDGGNYYHKKSCKVVKSATPKVTLIQAVNAGFKRCKTCQPPSLQDIYGDTLD